VAEIKAAVVKALRDQTGAGMMDCKRALTETGGDVEAAVAYLREKGLASAAKKAGRVAAEGLVEVAANADDTAAVVFELNCETDFVAKTDEFRRLVDTIGQALLAADSTEEGTGESVADLKAGSTTLGGLLKEAVASIGENISLRRFARLTTADGRIGSYVHAGGKIAVLVDVTGAGPADSELTRSLAMQVAAAVPRHVRREDVPEDEIASEREIFRAQALGSGKPANVVDRIVDGKIDKFFREVCLLEQEYVRDSQLTIDKLLAQEGESSGAKLDVRRFVRYQLGEGIERKESNLAEEVAEQLARGS
jgi:elongation factor Ts